MGYRDRRHIDQTSNATTSVDRLAVVDAARTRSQARRGRHYKIRYSEFFMLWCTLPSLRPGATTT